ncbi:unnamed protein product [Closterium sp. NIES-65]|nr:unnamed protein product [Closterium sp. NIES-65]CAI6008624.1 unnamed protein product [Closterium sp. NIES-65]
MTDAKDGVSLFDHASGSSVAPPDTADSLSRSHWQTRDAAARLTIRNYLPLAERAHFGQHKTAKDLYTAVVARYSSPATAALSRLFLPYLFPELSSFATVEDLISHLRASDLLTSLVLRRSALLLLLVGSAAAARVGAAGVVEVVEGGAVVEATGVVEVAEVAVGVVAGVEASVAAVAVAVGVEAAEAAAVGVVVVEAAAAVVAAVGAVAAALVAVGVEPFRGEALEVVRGSSSSSVRARPLHPSSFMSGMLSPCGKFHSDYRCFSRLDDAWRTQFPDAPELPRWADLPKRDVDIFALD